MCMSVHGTQGEPKKKGMSPILMSVYVYVLLVNVTNEQKYKNVYPSELQGGLTQTILEMYISYIDHLNCLLGSILHSQSTQLSLY